MRKLAHRQVFEILISLSFLKWYWLTWIVPDRGLLNSYSNVVVVIFCKLYVFKVFRGYEFVVLYIKDYQASFGTYCKVFESHSTTGLDCIGLFVDGIESLIKSLDLFSSSLCSIEAY